MPWWERENPIKGVTVTMQVIGLCESSSTLGIEQRAETGELGQSQAVKSYGVGGQATGCDSDEQLPIPKLHDSGEIVFNIGRQGLHRFA
jgi:hypothetical protein